MPLRNGADRKPQTAANVRALHRALRRGSKGQRTAAAEEKAEEEIGEPAQKLLENGGKLVYNNPHLTRE